MPHSARRRRFCGEVWKQAAAKQASETLVHRSILSWVDMENTHVSTRATAHRHSEQQVLHYRYYSYNSYYAQMQFHLHSARSTCTISAEGRARTPTQTPFHLHFAPPPRTISAEGRASARTNTISPAFRAFDAHVLCSAYYVQSQFHLRFASAAHDLRRGSRKRTHKHNFTCISRLRRARSPQRTLCAIAISPAFRLRHARPPQRVDFRGGLPGLPLALRENKEERCEDVRRCEKMSEVRRSSDVRRYQMWEDVGRYQMWEDVRKCQRWEDVRCEKMWENVRCEKMRCEKISHIGFFLKCRSICTSFFLKNPSLRRSRELKTFLANLQSCLNTIVTLCCLFATRSLCHHPMGSKSLMRSTNTQRRMLTQQKVGLTLEVTFNTTECVVYGLVYNT